jgi:hypothetical protein
LKAISALALLVLLAPMAAAQAPPVEGVEVESGNHVLQIRWKPVEGASSYTVHVYSDGAILQRINTTEAHATFRGTNDKAYAIQVSARDAQGVEGPLSPPVAGMPTLRGDQTYLALGLIIVWLGIWLYATLLTRTERRLQDRLDKLMAESPSPRDRA